MKKKIFFTVAIMAILVCAFCFTISAKSVYLEPIPDELKVEKDTATHFVVFEDEKYFTGSGGTISGLSSENIEADMASAEIDKSKIGTEYLTRFNFPAYFGGTLVTYVNLNSIKSNSYFKNVCGYVEIAGTVNKIHDMHECTKQLRCFDFGENSQVTSIPYCFMQGATKMMSVKNFPRSLNEVGGSAFNNCYGAFRGELYINAKTIGASAFNNAIVNVTSIVFGPELKSIGGQAMCVRVTEFPEFYSPEGRIPALESIEFQCDVSTLTFAKQGADSGSFYFPINSERTAYSKLETILLSHPNNAKYVTEGSIFNDFTADGITILFNDADGLDDYVTAKHDFSILGGISYESYGKAGVKTMICSKCGGTSNESVEPLFICYGYSAPQYGEGGISVGYSVNYDAIEAYESASGKTVRFGLFAVLKDNVGQSDIFDENGNDINGAIAADLTESGFNIFNLKIVGFSGEQTKAKLAMGAFVVTNTADVTEYSYIQDGVPSENEKYHFVSYDDLKSDEE